MKPQKKILLLLVLCCLTALCCNAQYIVVKKGFVVPFDTAIVTNAKTFKLESKKIGLLEKLVREQELELASAYKITELAKQQTAIQQQLAALSAKDTQSCLSAVDKLNTDLDVARKVIKKQGRWYNKNGLWFVVGAVSAFGLLR
jgi:hypothetical protein